MFTRAFHIAEDGWSAPFELQQFVIPTVVPLIVAPLGAYTTLSILEKLTHSEAANEKLVLELRSALADIDRLSGLLPICAACKDIKDDAGQWQSIEEFVSARSDADFTHGLCPSCADTMYPDHPT